MSSQIPLFRSLDVCTRRAKSDARIELGWLVGFAIIPLILVLFAVFFTRPLGEAPSALFDIAGRGEMMIYAASVCGAALYSLNYTIADPLPDYIQQRVTSLKTLTIISWICLFIAIFAYLVRRLGELNNFSVNEGILTWSSIVVLIFAVLIAYITFALKHSLQSGSTTASREQTEDFSAEWNRERDS